MNEAARLARNTERLGECFPGFHLVMRQVLNDLEAQGFRPRIQDAFRTEADQLKAFEAGFSGVKFGFHNITGAGGVKESLACDVLDDDHPVGTPPARYRAALTTAARNRGLDTPVSGDPLHVQPVGITIAQAKAGKRPTFGSAAVSGAGSSAGGHTHVVHSGETLSGIAHDAGLTLAQLLALNPSFAPHPNLVHVGDVLQLA